MKPQEPRYIRFDWAMKRLLRDKANYSVLEGLLTTLLNERIVINRLLESESNQEDEFDKYNRVDILAERANGDLVLIEVQNNNEYAYFQRMLFGTSKLVTEYIQRGQGYYNVRKVYSVNIVYFDLGHGTDYVYHGKTEFRGIHNNELLQLSPFQIQRFEVNEVSDLYPEYYILKVNNFNEVAKTPLEEWIYYLNTGEVLDGSTAPGLDGVREFLKITRMDKSQLAAYYRHLDNVAIMKDTVNLGIEESHMKGHAQGLAEGIGIGRAEGLAEGIGKGRAEGLAEGMDKGRAEGRAEMQTAIARSLKAQGIPAEAISAATGLTAEEIDRL